MPTPCEKCFILESVCPPNSGLAGKDWTQGGVVPFGSGDYLGGPDTDFPTNSISGSGNGFSGSMHLSKSGFSIQEFAGWVSLECAFCQLSVNSITVALDITGSFRGWVANPNPPGVLMAVAAKYGGGNLVSQFFPFGAAEGVVTPFSEFLSVTETNVSGGLIVYARFDVTTQVGHDLTGIVTVTIT